MHVLMGETTEPACKKNIKSYKRLQCLRYHISWFQYMMFINYGTCKALYAISIYQNLHSENTTKTHKPNTIEVRILLFCIASFLAVNCRMVKGQDSSGLSV